MADIPYVCLYRSYYEELENFSPEERGRLLWALLEYLCTGQEPELPAPESYFWPRLRSQHQRDAAHYVEVCEKNRENAVKGHQLRKKERTAKMERNRAVAAIATNGSEHAEVYAVAASAYHDAVLIPGDAVAAKEREKEKEKEREKECVLRTETHTHFSKPDIIQVREYCDEEGFTLVDAEKFVTYYDAVGWVCGGKPMKDWKAAVRLWNQTERAKIGEQNGLEGTWNACGNGTVV